MLLCQSKLWLWTATDGNFFLERVKMNEVARPVPTLPKTAASLSGCPVYDAARDSPEWFRWKKMAAKTKLFPHELKAPSLSGIELQVCSKRNITVLRFFDDKKLWKNVFCSRVFLAISHLQKWVQKFFRQLGVLQVHHTGWILRCTQRLPMNWRSTVYRNCMKIIFHKLIMHFRMFLTGKICLARRYKAAVLISKDVSFATPTS